MAPPIRYLSMDIAAAMCVARSMKQAAAFLGMSLGALRKRALGDSFLRPIALKCIARGKLCMGRGVT